MFDTGLEHPGCERPVAMAVAICRQRAPELLVDGAAAAVEAGEAASRTGYIRRRPEGEDVVASVDGPDCCFGLKGTRMWVHLEVIHRQVRKH